MGKSTDLIFKPNELIEVISRPVSLLGLKAYNSILKRLQTNNTDRMIITPLEILEEIGSTNSYDELYTYLDELQKTQVKSIDKRGKLWGSFVLISEFKKLDDGIFVAVPPSIYNVLCGKDKKQEEMYYTTIKLLEEKSYKCSYSIIFYEIFKKYEKVELPIYTVEELRNLTKTEDKYKIYADFKKRVIVPAIKEINSFDNRYIYSFSEEYLGRKVDKIRFLREEKPQQEDTAKQKLLPGLSDKLIKAIEKARKNRYIQEKYSQRAVDKAIEQFGEELVIKGLIELYKFQNPISSFSKILNAKIDDLKKLEVVKKAGTKHQDDVENIVINEITGSEKLQNKEKSLDELIEMASSKLMTKNLPADKKINLCKELLKVENEEELKKFCDKHDILLSLELF